MLQRVLRKGNPPTLLAGVNGTVTMHNSTEETLKTELPYDPAISLLGIYPEKAVI